jgi:RND family efflux transporter MFP subunit
MTIPGFLKKKRTYVIAILVLGLGWFLFAPKTKKPEDLYETAKVEKSTLKRTVEVTGEVKPAARIALSFSSAGTLARIDAKVGQEVKAGDVIAELDADSVRFAQQRAAASLAAAQAQLNLKLAGAMPQDIQVTQASYNKSLVDLANAKVSTANAVKNAQLAVETARVNRDTGATTNVKSISDAYADLRLSLAAALGPMQTSLIDGDRIIGVDDGVTNSSYRSVIGLGNAVALAEAQRIYTSAKTLRKQAEAAATPLSASSTQVQIDAAATIMQQALLAVQDYLTQVQYVLAATIPGNGLSDTGLATMKASIDADRSSVSTQKATIENNIQASTSAKLGQTTSQEQLENAYDTAVLNLEVAESNATTQVSSAETAVEIAKANLDLKKAPPRAVDVAPLRAAVAEAQVSYDQATNDLAKARITAPVDGTVSEIIPTIGEQITPNTPIVRMIGFADYDVEILLPEADVAKVSVGQTTTITLDAYGDSVEFAGSVVSEEPDQTVVQDAVYYKARIAVDKASATDRDIKPGMTANVTILTGKSDNTLVIPARAVKTDQAAGTQSVRILKDGKPEERTVQTGLRGDDGLVEVTSGVGEGDTVIVSEKS